MKKSKIIFLIFAFLSFCFLAFVHPEWLNFHEQYQLFEFSTDYFVEHIVLPGGFVVWFSEFFVQFFYNNFLGALVMTGCLTGIYLLLKNGDNQIALLPPVLIWIYSGDENMMMTFPFAVLLSLFAVKGFERLTLKNKFYLQILIVPLIYWLVGYCAWIYLILSLSKDDNGFRIGKENFIKISALILYLIVFQFFTAFFITRNYPLIDIFCGIDYYRLRMEIPDLQHIITLCCVVVPFVKIPQKKWVMYTQLSLIVVVLVVGVIKKYDFDRYSYYKIDYMVRNQEWEKLLDFAKKYNLQSDFASTGVNLALAMTGQMPDRLFEFNQTSNEGFLSTFGYNSFTCTVTAEACYYLGLVNSVLRYNFDLQSAILNCNYSGRFTKRIAEAYILNGRYDVARRYLNKLKRTLFYRAWALKAEDFICNTHNIESNPDWKRLNSIRIKRGLNFSNPHLGEMLMYFSVMGGENRMALDYALSSFLVKRDLKSFVESFPYYTKYFGTSQIPKIYQQAFLLACVQSGYSIDRIPNFISPEIISFFRDFDTAYLLNKNSKVFKTGKYAGTYWKYYLLGN